MKQHSTHDDSTNESRQRIANRCFLSLIKLDLYISIYLHVCVRVCYLLSFTQYVSSTLVYNHHLHVVQSRVLNVVINNHHLALDLNQNEKKDKQKVKHHMHSRSKMSEV